MKTTTRTRTKTTTTTTTVRVGRTWRVKPPWIDQGWSLVAGALANRGVHPPPTTSRPSLPPRCGCTPDCLRKLATDRHPSREISVSVPLPRRVRKRVARLLARHPAWPARSLARSLTRSPSRASLALPSRPSCRTTSSGADLPRGQPTPPSTTEALPPSGVDTENHHRHPRTYSRRLSYASTAITFAGKSSGAVGEPGLTLQGAVRGHDEPRLFFLLFFLFGFYFFPFFLFHLVLRLRGKQPDSLSHNR